MKKILCILVAITSVLACSSGAEKQKEEPHQYYHTTGKIFRTSANIKYGYTQALDQEIFNLLDSFDLCLNPFNKQSIIYKVNNNQDVEINEWFEEVITIAAEVSRQTGGLYDITAAPLINLWGFGYGKEGEPDPKKIDSLRQIVGFEKIRIEGKRVVKSDPRVQLNASSIAKGYAVDIVAEMLEEKGIEDYMVEIGGEVRARGVNPHGNHWQIEISRPEDNNSGGEVGRYTIVQLRNSSLATSGDSRNYYIKDGRKYAHTINPVSGYPAGSDILSVSVRHPRCIVADAYATAFMVLGLENAKKLAEKVPQLECLFIFEGKNGGYASIQSPYFQVKE